MPIKNITNFHINAMYVKPHNGHVLPRLEMTKKKSTSSCNFFSAEKRSDIFKYILLAQ